MNLMDCQYVMRVFRLKPMDSLTVKSVHDSMGIRKPTPAVRKQTQRQLRLLVREGFIEERKAAKRGAANLYFLKV